MAKPHSQQRMKALMDSIGASLFSKALAVGLSLISVPIALRYLGTEQYGLWATITSLVGMLVFADLGIGNGMLNAVAQANGRDSAAGVRRAIAAGVTAVALTAAVLLLMFLAIWPFVNWSQAFAVQGPANVREVALAVLVLVVIFTFNMPVSTIQKVQYGLQQGRWISLSHAFAAVLSLGMTLAVVHFDLGLAGLVACFVLASLLADTAFGALFLSRFPTIIPHKSDWDTKEFQALFKVGLSFLFLQVGVSLCFASDNLILAQLLGNEAVAVYSVHQKLFSPITIVAAMALAPLWPAFADAISRRDYRWVKRVLWVSCAGILVWAAISGAALLIASDWIMKHWLKGQISANAMLGWCLVVWGCVDVVGRTISTFLNGAGMLKQQMLNVAIFVPLCIALKVILVREIGLYGVVVGTIIAWVVVNVPAYAILIHRWNKSHPTQPAGDGN